MKSLIILTEVYDPEKFIINDVVKSFLEKNIKISLVSRVPSYPTGIPFKGYKNRLKKYKISENFETECLLILFLVNSHIFVVA